MLESQREPVPFNDDNETDTALAFLSFGRSCVLKKLDGLDEGKLRRRLVVSDTTLLGLVQHLTGAERYWFGYTVAGDPRYADAGLGMTVAEDQSAGQVIAGYRNAAADSDAHIRAAGDLDVRTAQAVNGEPRTLRWVLAHMTSETTRHAGHADILRELIDGTTGR
ncbi:DinB family protein [Actinoplanes sp. DH11]|uniref:DinB family protein n=1 Tax=Actinoplanes sp. DH11 TaxID=2857011 RepID=UPI001E392413|nr:DinB family protein [Actinoplanes sp. DH11]